MKCSDCDREMGIIRYRFGDVRVCATCAVVRMTKGEHVHVERPAEKSAGQAS